MPHHACFHVSRPPRGNNVRTYVSKPCLPCRTRPCHTMRVFTCPGRPEATTYVRTFPNHACRAAPDHATPCVFSRVQAAQRQQRTYVRFQTMPAVPHQTMPHHACFHVSRPPRGHNVRTYVSKPCLPCRTRPCHTMRVFTCPGRPEATTYVR